MLCWHVVQRFVVRAMNDPSMGLALQAHLANDDEGSLPCLARQGDISVGLEPCDPSDRAQGWAFQLDSHMLLHVESRQCMDLAVPAPTDYDSDEGEPPPPAEFESDAPVTVPVLTPCGTPLVMCALRSVLHGACSVGRFRTGRKLRRPRRMGRDGWVRHDQCAL